MLTDNIRSQAWPTCTSFLSSRTSHRRVDQDGRMKRTMNRTRNSLSQAKCMASSRDGPTIFSSSTRIATATNASFQSPKTFWHGKPAVRKVPTLSERVRAGTTRTSPGTKNDSAIGRGRSGSKGSSISARRTITWSVRIPQAMSYYEAI